MLKPEKKGHKREKSVNQSDLPIIAIHDASSCLGMAACRQLAKEEDFNIRACVEGYVTKELKEAFGAISKNITVIECDITDHDSLNDAFKFAYGVFAFTSGKRSLPEYEQGRRLISAIKQSFTKHFVFCSSGVEQRKEKQEVEYEVRQSRVPFTIAQR